MESFNVLSVLSFLLVLTGSCADKLPSNLKRCTLKDQSCLKDAIEDSLPKLKNGIPELKVPSLDPMHFENIEIAPGASVVQMVQKFKDVHYSGIANAKITYMNFDIENGKMEFNLTAPIFELIGHYEFNGKILVLPIKGAGPCDIRIEGVTAHLVFDVELATRNNQKYIVGKDGILKVYPEHAVFKFDNLFDGNAALSDTLHKAMNEQWRVIYDEVIDGYTQVYVNGLLNFMNALFKKIPISEVFLN